MSEFPPKAVEVAVTVIRRDDLLLAGYNPNWGAFTLPMTKRRKFAKPGDPQMIMSEPWEEAAIRNVVEWFGKTITAVPSQLIEIHGFRQSDRDLVVKEYYFQVFEVHSPADDPLLKAVVAEWLSPAQFLDVKRRPVSPTARYILGELTTQEKL